jgi:hypothetical protein
MVVPNGDATTFFDPGDRCCVGAAGARTDLIVWQRGRKQVLQHVGDSGVAARIPARLQLPPEPTTAKPILLFANGFRLRGLVYRRISRAVVLLAPRGYWSPF